MIIYNVTICFGYVYRPGTVDGGGLDQGFGDRKHAGQKEQEIVADIAHHRPYATIGIEGCPGFGHQLVNRLDGPFGTHHGGGADLADLNDMRL
ncbi:MAG: hypothetical protein GY850_46640 [bacterium]|nr:hypothetical protein [bacterium]